MRLQPFRNSLLSSALSSLLIFQMVISSVLLPQASAQLPVRGSDPVTSTIQEVSSGFEAALGAASGLPSVDERGLPPISRSAHLHPHQFHRVYDRNGAIAAEYNLARIDIANPNIEIGDPTRELRFAYSPERRELEIQRVVTEGGTTRVTDAHVFKDIVLTSNVLADASMGYFATGTGTHAFLMRHLQSSFCKKVLVTPVVLPADPTAAVTHLEFFTQEVRPQPIGGGLVDDGDLLLTFGGNRVVRVNRAETILNLGSNLLGLLGLVQVVNPDLDSLELYQKIFQENAADLAKFVEDQRALVDDPANDLVTHALRAWGQKLDYSELGFLFERDSQGQNQFQSLAAAPRNRVSADPSAGSTWSRNHAIIEAGKADDITVGRAPRTWRQILVDHYTGKDVRAEEAKAAAKKEMSLRKRMLSRIEAFYSKYATRQRIARTAIALGAVGVDQVVFNGAGAHWVFAGMNQMLNWSAEVPLLGNLTGPIAKSIGFFSDPAERWGVMRLVAGTAAVLALNPISYAVAKVISDRAKNNWSAVRAFFTYGTRVYAVINYPIQKLLIWDRLRQKGLYEAIVHNKADPLSNRTLYNSPVASSEQLAAKASEVNASLEADAIRRGRAVLLAAAIVSESQSAQGHPLDIASLLLASQEKDFNPARMLDELSGAAGNARWTDVTQQAYSGLVALGDEGGKISRAELDRYVELYRKLALKLQAEAGDSGGLLLRKLLRRSRNLMSRKVLPMLMFGQQWYEAYHRYSNVQLTDSTLEIAKHGFNEDYGASGLIYALTDPRKFAQIPIAGIGAPEIVTNQWSQVFVYGVQGAIDPPNPHEGLSNPYTPLTNDIFAKRRERQQTVREGLRSAGRAVSDGSVFRQHASVMEKLVEGLQVRFAADFFTRAIGLYLTMYLMNEHPNALEIAGRSLQLSGFFLLAKISFQAGAGGFVPGYATIWPYIQMSMSRMQGDAAANLEQIQLADYLLTTAAEVKDRQMLRDGVELLQELYKKGRKTLPTQYRVAPSEFSFELAAEFHQQSLKPENIPLSTQPNKALFANVNRAGALVSTVLFAGVSAIAMDPSTNAGELLVKSLAWFGITYGAMKVAAGTVPVAVEKVKAGVRTIGQSVNDICNRVFGQSQRF